VPSQTTHKKDIERLFRENYNRLYFFAFSIIHDAESAKDIVSDAFHQAWENHREKVSNSQLMVPFLHVCVKNSCLDYLRRQHVSQRYEEYILGNPNEMEDQDLSEREERMTRVLKSIEELPPQTKNVFKRCFLDGKKYKEVSDEMNISVNTIKTHIIKALKSLRGEFSQEE
jgi:RNA polymerase sigma-70 factor (ECF subfamily)